MGFLWSGRRAWEPTELLWADSHDHTCRQEDDVCPCWTKESRLKTLMHRKGKRIWKYFCVQLQKIKIKVSTCFYFGSSVKLQAAKC